jgi:hypothetical protein
MALQSHSQNSARLITSIAAISALILSVGCTGKPKVEKIITLPDSSGLSVFELLESFHEVEYDRSPSGVFVKAIDSVSNTRFAYWIYFVNDSAGMVASDKYMLSGGEKVEWRLMSSQ